MGKDAAMAPLGDATRGPETGAFRDELRPTRFRAGVEIAPTLDKPSASHPTTASMRTAWIWGLAG